MNTWSHDGELYEVVSGYDVADGAWFYELTPLADSRGDDPAVRPDRAVVEVRVPDATPEAEGFAPSRSRDVTVSWFGTGQMPWPVLRKFLELVQSSGDIVETAPKNPLGLA